MELDLSVIESAAAAVGPVEAPVISPYPVATQDVALLVPERVPADEVNPRWSRASAAATTRACSRRSAVRRLHRRAGRPRA